ncbi:MAG: hypothetical protein ACOC6P_02765 [Candidatus Aminicenantaceae bacterium]
MYLPTLSASSLVLALTWLWTENPVWRQPSIFSTTAFEMSSLVACEVGSVLDFFIAAFRCADVYSLVFYLGVVLMSDSIDRQEHIKNLVLKTIKTIINQFHRKPDIFFNEHDFHQYCYHSFYRQKEFSKMYPTSDGRMTNILHPEYPTLEKFLKKEPRLDEKGVRARYDMAILNPDFIENNEFEKIRCRDISKFDAMDYRMKNLLAVLEFKFIIRHGESYKHEICYDYFKLKHAAEADLKCMLVFTNTDDKEIDYFKELGLRSDKNIKKIYVAVFRRDGKKEKKVIQYPSRWLE